VSLATVEKSAVLDGMIVVRLHFVQKQGELSQRAFQFVCLVCVEQSANGVQVERPPSDGNDVKLDWMQITPSNVEDDVDPLG
jgi:hypothetical protein